MSEIATNEVIEILDKIEMFQGQRAGRELWADKPEEIQEKDLENFNRDVEIIRKYVKETQNVLERIVERVEEARQKYQRLQKEQGEKEDEAMNILFRGMMNIVKEEGGIE